MKVAVQIAFAIIGVAVVLFIVAVILVGGKATPEKRRRDPRHRGFAPIEAETGHPYSEL
jgi:hypothetical protein